MEDEKERENEKEREKEREDDLDGQGCPMRIPKENERDAQMRELYVFV